ncbi:MAG: phenylalanine--tRNA ligase subunit beta [Candidatus Altiarchaeota archaeon]
MPTVEFNFREVCTLLGRPFKPAELKDVIPMLGVGLERIDETTLVMEVFPNRTDLLSVEGFSRALKGFLGLQVGGVSYPVLRSNVVLNVEASVKTVRPCIACAVIEDVVIDEPQLISLMNMQEKLHLTHGRDRRRVAIGVHDSRRLKPPYYYTAVKPDSVSFVPLDMPKELNLSQILINHPKGRAYAWALRGLEKYPLIVDSAGQVLSFPPIINGELTRVSADTENIFVEITGLNQPAVEQALNIVCTSIADRHGRLKSVEVRGL